MPNLNRVMLMGNLTRDPELRFTPNQTPVASFGLAINRRWRDQQGEWHEEVDFIDCELLGRRAEAFHKYLKKGRPVFVEGRLKLDQWKTKENENRSKLKVMVENFEFIDSRGEGGGGGGGGGYDAEGSSGGDGGDEREVRREPDAGRFRAGGAPRRSGEGSTSGGPRPEPPGRSNANRGGGYDNPPDTQPSEDDIPF